MSKSSNQIELTSIHPLHSKTNLLTAGCGKGKYNISYRVPSKENGLLILKSPDLPLDLRQGFLKTNVRIFGKDIIFGNVIFYLKLCV